MRQLFVLLLVGSVLVACAGEDFYELSVGGVPIQVEVADTSESRARGLMFREELPENRGMLFVFDALGIRAFYMRNTSIPLSIAYIDERLVIREIHDMDPFSEESIFSSVPVRFALEVNQGAFSQWGITPGDRLVPSAELANRLNLN